MLYGYTPFRGKTRQRTFANVLQKDIKFPGSKVVSLFIMVLSNNIIHTIRERNDLKAYIEEVSSVIVKYSSFVQVSLQAKQLIYRLLHKDPKNRLGAREGANEIKQHPFFHGINWALVRCQVF